MKKTLKLLMAITLFVAVLLIATGVNAATTHEKGIDMETLMNKVNTAGTDKITKSDAGYVIAAPVTLTAANATLPANEKPYDYIKINGNVTINPTAALTGDVIVESGKLTVLAGAGTLGDVEVRNGATLLLKGTVNKITNEGTTELYTGSGVTSRTIENKERGTIYSQIAATITNDKGIVYGDSTNAASVANPASVAYTGVALDKKVKLNDDEYDTMFLSNDELAKITFAFKAWTDSTTSTKTLEAGKTYEKVEIIAFYGDKELDTTVSLDTAAIKPEDNYTVDANGKVKIADDAKTVTIKFTNPWAAKIATTAFEATKKIEVNLGAQPTEAVPTTPVATTPVATDAANKGDKDETPKTGDQIIPATALLAVVVVANVVYFAKSKRS